MGHLTQVGPALAEHLEWLLEQRPSLVQKMHQAVMANRWPRIDVENPRWKPREMIKNTGVLVHIYILVAVKTIVHPKKGGFFHPPPGRGLEDCHLKMVDSWGLYGSMLVGGCWLVTRVSIYGKTTLHPLVDPHIPFRNGILRVVPHFQTDPI